MEHTVENRQALFGRLNKALEDLRNFEHKPGWTNEDKAEHMRLLECWAEARDEVHKFEHGL
jgi:hypothetical protein